MTIALDDQDDPFDPRDPMSPDQMDGGYDVGHLGVGHLEADDFESEMKKVARVAVAELRSLQEQAMTQLASAEGSGKKILRNMLVSAIRKALQGRKKGFLNSDLGGALTLDEYQFLFKEMLRQIRKRGALDAFGTSVCAAMGGQSVPIARFCKDISANLEGHLRTQGDRAIRITHTRASLLAA